MVPFKSSHLHSDSSTGTWKNVPLPTLTSRISESQTTRRRGYLEASESQGFYAAALTQFWLEKGPVWQTRRSLSAVQLSAGGRSRPGTVSVFGRVQCRVQV